MYIMGTKVPDEQNQSCKDCLAQWNRLPEIV